MKTLSLFALETLISISTNSFNMSHFDWSSQTPGFSKRIDYQLLEPKFLSSRVRDYGPWKTTSCHKGIDFCINRGEYNESAKKYKWWVKFRNRYYETAHISVGATESYNKTPYIDSRIHIKPGGERVLYGIYYQRQIRSMYMLTNFV